MGTGVGSKEFGRMGRLVLRAEWGCFARRAGAG